MSGLAAEGWKGIPVARSDLSQWQVVGRKHSVGIPSGVQGHEQPPVSTINRFGGLIESAILPGQRVVNMDLEASCSHDLGGMEHRIDKARVIVEETQEAMRISIQPNSKAILAGLTLQLRSLLRAEDNVVKQRSGTWASTKEEIGDEVFQFY
ncbi:hypothetical protein Dimus_019083 [Dionaea muscipula]